MWIVRRETCHTPGDARPVWETVDEAHAATIAEAVAAADALANLSHSDTDDVGLRITLHYRAHPATTEEN